MDAKTLDSHLADYLNNRLSLNYSPKTVKDMRANLTPFVAWLDKTHEVRTPDALRPDHIRAWQQNLLARKTWNGFPIKPLTIRGRLGQVRSFLNHLADRGFILRTMSDVLERIKVPNLLPRSVLEHGQMKKLLSRIDTSTRYGFRDRTIMELLYSSGLRAGEILALDVAGIDFDNKTTRVMGKGRKERVTPVGRTALRFLKSYIVAVRPFFVHNPNEPALFLDRDGERYAYHNLQRVIRQYTRKMDFDFPITAHTFRRSCTTELIRGGANIYHVKELLGHESLDTLKHYTRLTILDLQKTHEKCHPREADEPRETS